MRLCAGAATFGDGVDTDEPENVTAQPSSLGEDVERGGDNKNNKSND